MSDSEGTETMVEEAAPAKAAGSPPPMKAQSASAQARTRRAARPNQHGLLSIFDEAHRRYTHAWYFRPPVPRPGGMTTTGLPIDVFYHADAYTADLVNNQTQKAVVYDDGNVEEVRIVTPIDRYGMRSKGVPVAVMRSPMRNPEAEQNWQRIVEVMEWARPTELEYEREALASLEEDLRAPGSLTPPQRVAYRERARVLEARIAHLEAGYDWPGILAFFENEAALSEGLVRTPEARMQELIEEGVAAALQAARV